MTTPAQPRESISEDGPKTTAELLAAELTDALTKALEIGQIKRADIRGLYAERNAIDRKNQVGSIFMTVIVGFMEKGTPINKDDARIALESIKKTFLNDGSADVSGEQKIAHSQNGAATIQDIPEQSPLTIRDDVQNDVQEALPTVNGGPPETTAATTPRIYGLAAHLPKSTKGATLISAGIVNLKDIDTPPDSSVVSSVRTPRSKEQIDNLKSEAIKLADKIRGIIDENWGEDETEIMKKFKTLHSLEDILKIAAAEGLESIWSKILKVCLDAAEDHSKDVVMWAFARVATVYGIPASIRP